MKTSWYERVVADLDRHDNDLGTELETQKALIASLERNARRNEELLAAQRQVIAGLRKINEQLLDALEAAGIPARTLQPFRRALCSPG